MKDNKWVACYDESWKDIIVPEAFSHPAKMSYGLLSRILSHAQEQGWLAPQSIILDPFGGIGSTGILGAYEGYQVVCVELEQKFVDLTEQNYKLHDNAWQKLGCPRPVMLQGDSRELSKIVSKADLLVSSPPFLQGDKVQARSGFSPGWRKIPFNKRMDKCPIEGNYGHTPGQLGSMKAGEVNAIISSPPYADQHVVHIKTNMGEAYKTMGPAGHCCHDGYGKIDGNLGNLKSGNPPKRASLVLSSPPYEGSMNNEQCGIDWSKAKKDYPGRVIHDKRIAMHQKHHTKRKYGEGNEQLGSQIGETFFSAAKIIREQCFQILKPGGHAIWVVKSFVRKGKIVDFPGDWQRLCESVGFKTVCIHHAMLVKETRHKTLFGHTEIKRKERKSFFRRLAESKGAPRIDYEVVLCMSRPVALI